jgi:hypothetical protein
MQKHQISFELLRKRWRKTERDFRIRSQICRNENCFQIDRCRYYLSVGLGSILSRFPKSSSHTNVAECFNDHLKGPWSDVKWRWKPAIQSVTLLGRGGPG